MQLKVTKEELPVCSRCEKPVVLVLIPTGIGSERDLDWIHVDGLFSCQTVESTASCDTAIAPWTPQAKIAQAVAS